jgi:hypothetical protein
MLGFRGLAQPSPTLGDALNAGYLYLEVRCLGCDTHQTVALDVVRADRRQHRSTNLSGTCAATHTHTHTQRRVSPEFTSLSA